MKKTLLSAFLPIVIFSALFAQEKVDMQMTQKIKDEEKNNSQIAMIAHNITDICGPRLTNSPGYNRSLDWISQTLSLW